MQNPAFGTLLKKIHVAHQSPVYAPHLKKIYLTIPLLPTHSSQVPASKSLVKKNTIGELPLWYL